MTAQTPIQQTDFADARRFIKRVVPWTPGAYINLHWFPPKKNPHSKAPAPGTFTTSVDNFINKLTYRAAHPEKYRDLYFCTASQKKAETKTNETTGEQYEVALRNAENAVEQKCFRIDLDVGKMKNGVPHGCQTPQEAIAAIAQLMKLTGLPKPTAIVSSGSGGFHVYWIVTVAIKIEDWQPYADALVVAADESGMVFDDCCTSDCVRIMRVPDTLNYKSDQPNPVTLEYLLPDDYPNEQILDCLKPWVGRGKAVTVKGKGGGQPGLNAEFMVEREYPPADINKVAEGCGWVKNSIDTGGVENDNTLRRFAFCLAARCTDPREAAWAMMQDRDTLTPEEFNLELDRAQGEHAKKELPLPYCASINQAGAGACKGCPHLNAGKNPLAFAGGSQPDEPTPSELQASEGGDALEASRFTPSCKRAHASGDVRNKCSLSASLATSRVSVSKPAKYPCNAALLTDDLLDDFGVDRLEAGSQPFGNGGSVDLYADVNLWRGIGMARELAEAVESASQSV